jgi:hypothetical protein
MAAKINLGMESCYSVVLRRRADLAMEWCEEGNTQMVAIYSRLREYHEALKREGAWAGIGWGAPLPEDVPVYWPTIPRYGEGNWNKGLDRSLVAEGLSWDDNHGIEPRREGDIRLSSIGCARFWTTLALSNKQRNKNLRRRGLTFRSQLVGPDGLTVLP